MFSPGDSVQIALRTSKTPGAVIGVMFRKSGVTYDVWDGNTTLRDMDESMLESYPLVGGYSGPQFYYNCFKSIDFSYGDRQRGGSKFVDLFV